MAFLEEANFFLDALSRKVKEKKVFMDLSFEIFEYITTFDR